MKSYTRVWNRFLTTSGHLRNQLDRSLLTFAMTGLGEEKMSVLTHVFLNCTALPTGEGGASRIVRGKAGPTKPAKWLDHVLVVIREESIAWGGLQETNRGFLWFKRLGQYRSCLSYIFILSLSPFIFFSLSLSPTFALLPLSLPSTILF